MSEAHLIPASKPADTAGAPDTAQSQNCGRWFEIPVSDLEAARAFYGAVLQQPLKIEDGGPNPVVMLPFDDDTPGIGGHLYPGTPARDGATIHLVVSDSLDAARARIEAAGGSVESPDIQIPPGHFFYARDPDGNSLGMFRFHG